MPSRSQLNTSPLKLGFDAIECELQRHHGKRSPTDDRGSRQDQERRHLNSPTLVSIRGRPDEYEMGLAKGHRGQASVTSLLRSLTP